MVLHKKSMIAVGCEYVRDVLTMLHKSSAPFPKKYAPIDTRHCLPSDPFSYSKDYKAPKNNLKTDHQSLARLRILGFLSAILACQKISRERLDKIAGSMSEYTQNGEQFGELVQALFASYPRLYSECVFLPHLLQETVIPELERLLEMEHNKKLENPPE